MRYGGALGPVDIKMSGMYRGAIELISWSYTWWYCKGWSVVVEVKPRKKDVVG